MMMDLSFWEPPNWQKESRISPYFWIGITVFVLLSVVAGYVVNLNMTIANTGQHLAETNSIYKTLEPSYKDFVNKGKYYKDIKNIFMGDLRERAGRRRLASSTMQQLFEMIPDNMVLDDFSLEAFSYTIDKKSSKSKSVINSVRYKLAFSGTVTGVRSEKDVREFVRKIGREDGFGEQIVSAEVVKSRNESDVQTVFAIECLFKEK